MKQGIQQAEECSDRVKKMLCASLTATIGTPAAERHPFNARFVTMIEQVLQGENARLQRDIAAKDATFGELSPAKATREAALDQAKAHATEQNEALIAAKQAVTDANAAVKAATAEVKTSKKAQHDGDAYLEDIAGKKSALEEVVRDSLKPIVDGTTEEEARAATAKVVVDTGKSYGFDSSLMNTAATLLEKPASERGAFDMTCLQQVQDAFASQIGTLDGELAAGAAGKAERAAAVEHAEAAKQAAENSQSDLKGKAAAAQEAKSAADAAAKAAAKSLADFMPDLKAAGDALDSAKSDLQSFIDGSEAAFNELKQFKENDFHKLPYYETVDGMKCDRGVIAACRAAVEGGATPGRVSEDDAKSVFAKIADGGKETRTERWTLRHCLQEFKWTDGAHDWIVEALKNVHQEAARPAKKARTEGKSYYEQIDGFKCDRGIIDACKEAVAVEGGDGRVSLEDAGKVWAKAAEGSAVTMAEKWTLRYCMSAFNWSRPAHDFMVEKLQAA